MRYDTGNKRQVAILASLDALFGFNQSASLMPAAHPIRMHRADLDISMLDPTAIVVEDNVWPEHFKRCVGSILLNQYTGRASEAQAPSLDISDAIMSVDYMAPNLAAQSVDAFDIKLRSTGGSLRCVIAGLVMSSSNCFVHW